VRKILNKDINKLGFWYLLKAGFVAIFVENFSHLILKTALSKTRAVFIYVKERKMELSLEARSDLRNTLEKEIGVENTDKMSNEDLNHIGGFLLEVFKQGLKRRVGFVSTI